MYAQVTIINHLLTTYSDRLGSYFEV